MGHDFLKHIRLLTAVATGVVLFFVLPGIWGILVRVLVSWNAGVALFMIWIFLWMRGCSAEQLQLQFKEEDESAIIFLGFVVCAALLSLLAIGLLLSSVKEMTGLERTIHIFLAALTVSSSWLLVPTMFTLHYTDAFYSASGENRPLLFPATEEPLFWDFVYFSFTIAAGSQTADVSTASMSIRKAVLAQSLIAFVFNVSILGLAVNISAGLFSG